MVANKLLRKIAVFLNHIIRNMMTLRFHYKAVSSCNLTIPVDTYWYKCDCFWTLCINSANKIMEWNYVAICIFATIGFAIPFVICCLVFFVCDPKIPKNPQVKIISYTYNTSYIELSSVSYKTITWILYTAEWRKL